MTEYVDTTRYKNLIQLYNEVTLGAHYDPIEVFAQRLQISEQRASLLVLAVEELSNKWASWFEGMLGLPQGWFDIQAEDWARPYVHTMQDVVMQFRSMPVHERKIYLDEMRALADRSDV